MTGPVVSCYSTVLEIHSFYTQRNEAGDDSAFLFKTVVIKLVIGGEE